MISFVVTCSPVILWERISAQRPPSVSMASSAVMLSVSISCSAYAPVTIGNKTIDALIYSVTYNGSYLAAEGIITIIVISIPPVKKALDYVEQMANSR